MGKPRVPIDNCPHEMVWDEIAQEEYCRFCGLIIKEEPGGWIEPNDDSNL